MRLTWSVALLVALAGPVAAQETETPADRHEARREWLARRRAGAHAPDTGVRVRSAPRRGGEEPRSGPRRPAVPSEAERPHRFEGRYRPGYDADLDARQLWPLDVLDWGRSYGWGSGWRGPRAPWPGGSWGHGLYATSCVRVLVHVEGSAPITLFLELPPALPWDAAELELLLDRELTRGRPLLLQDEYGNWVRLHPGARIEGLAAARCGER